MPEEKKPVAKVKKSTEAINSQGWRPESARQKNIQIVKTVRNPAMSNVVEVEQPRRFSSYESIVLIFFRRTFCTISEILEQASLTRIIYYRAL